MAGVVNSESTNCGSIADARVAENAPVSAAFAV